METMETAGLELNEEKREKMRIMARIADLRRQQRRLFNSVPISEEAAARNSGRIDGLDAEEAALKDCLRQDFSDTKIQDQDWFMYLSYLKGVKYGQDNYHDAVASEDETIAKFVQQYGDIYSDIDYYLGIVRYYIQKNII